MSRCPGHTWEHERTDYTTERYKCTRCGRRRGVWKNRADQFEALNKILKPRPKPVWPTRGSLVGDDCETHH